MNIKFSILIILLASCNAGTVSVIANTNCRYNFHAGGLEICSEQSLDPQEIEYAVQVVEEQTALKYPQVVNLAGTLEENGVSVYITDDPLSLNCEEMALGVYRCEDHIGGVNFSGLLIFVRYDVCSAFIPLGHELLHSIEQFYLNDIPHGDHETPWLFEQNYHDSPRDTVEFKIFMELFENVPSCADEWEAYRIGQGL